MGALPNPLLTYIDDILSSARAPQLVEGDDRDGSDCGGNLHITLFLVVLVSLNVSVAANSAIAARGSKPNTCLAVKSIRPFGAARML